MPYVMGRMLFIHVPKTGGHSVLKVMRANGGFRAGDEWGYGFRSHQSAWTIKARLKEKWYDYDRVSLVRNPWDRAVSLYFGKDKITSHSPAGFQKYMRRCIDAFKHRWSPWRLQTVMLSDEVKVFRLDDIAKLYEWMALEHGAEIGTPEVLKTGKNRYVERLPYQAYYTPELLDQVAEAHVKEIKKYKWSFE